MLRILTEKYTWLYTWKEIVHVLGKVFVVHSITYFSAVKDYHLHQHTK